MLFLFLVFTPQRPPSEFSFSKMKCFFSAQTMSGLGASVVVDPPEGFPRLTPPSFVSPEKGNPGTPWHVHLFFVECPSFSPDITQVEAFSTPLLFTLAYNAGSCPLHYMILEVYHPLPFMSPIPWIVLSDLNPHL